MAPLPTYYLSHGGGPWPYMEGPMRASFQGLESSLLATRAELGDAPKAVLVISGHWEEAVFSVSSSARPGMIYDYYGFPEPLYHIRYPAPGSPDLAARVRAMLEAGGFEARLDPERGFDHGTFSLMKPLYPDADIPIVQLAMQADYDPQAHISVGRLLAPLREEGVLIVGSGSSYHNLRDRGPDTVAPSRRFDAWLQETLVASGPTERLARLANWTAAPDARRAHPREDHLIPLMVALGAAQEEAGACVFHEDDFFGGWSLSSFRFGEAPAFG